MPGPVGAFGLWLASYVPALLDGYKLRGREFEPEHCRYKDDTWDFNLKAGATLELPWTVIDVSATGAPTLAYVTNAAGGRFRIKHTANSQVEDAGLYFADHNPYVCNFAAGAAGPIIDFAVEITPGATFVAGDILVIGVAGDRGQTAGTDADLDTDVTKSAWFRIEAGVDIYCETDDTVTDKNDIDTGIDIASGTTATKLWLRIDMTNGADVKFYLRKIGTHDDFVRVCSSTTFDMSGDDFTVQPFIELQKNSGTYQHQVDIDLVNVRQPRSVL